MSAKSIFEKRLEQYQDELKWLYCELYDEQSYGYFLDMLRMRYEERKDSLKASDKKRLENPDWCRSNELMGMMLYTENFGGTLQGVKEKLPYLKDCGVNYLHLMPLLDSPKGKSDGGYSVADFKAVRPDLGTIADFEDLTAACRRRHIMVCIDFVLNHTSDEHEWARAARAGDPAAQNRYFCFDNWRIPDLYQRDMPEVFPETAPGNFTYIKEMNKVVMTTFHPYQWDLNYHNPMVFNDMTDNLLFIANKGVDVVRLDAIPYIWKTLGTNCRNLPEVHKITRMMKLACDIVCPGILLLGEVVMEPKEVVPYFGSVENPECDILYNVTTMCTTWHTVATKDTRLLTHQIEAISGLPHEFIFQNYLRCHDDIGWGLDYGFLGQFGTDERAHKKFLNEYLTGKFYGSPARGELYNVSEKLGDGRLCGMTASFTGIESALYEKDEEKLEDGIRYDLMLHAWMFTQKGIPVIYSGDEIGMLNDYGYHTIEEKKYDSRNIHRGEFMWDLAEKRHDGESIASKIFEGLQHLIEIRKSYDVFRSDAEIYPYYTYSDNILGVVRIYKDHMMVGLFNFADEEKLVNLDRGKWIDLVRGKHWNRRSVTIEGHGFRWLLAEPLKQKK